MRKPCSKPPSDEGATFLGTLVALALILVVMGAAYPLLSGGLSAMSRASGAAAGARKAVLVDAAIRKLAERVRAPFWARAPGLGGSGAKGSGELETAWLDGLREASAYLKATGSTLELGAGEAIQRFERLEGLSIRWLEGEGGASLGFEVAYSTSGRTWTTRAPFGGLPFVAGAEP